MRESLTKVIRGNPVMRAVLTVFVALVWLLSTERVVAHHSFAAVFDINRPIALTGVVTRLEWTNPHAWIHMEVDQAGNDLQVWSIELLGINSLLKQGWNPGALKPGDTIHVQGFGARDGSTSVNASVVTMAETGEQLWVSAPRDE